MNCSLNSLKRHFSQRLGRSSSLSQHGYYFLHTKLSGKNKGEIKISTIANFSFSLHFCSLCSSVCFTLSMPAIKCNFSLFANHNLCWRQHGPSASEKWPMCHHLIFAPSAITAIITAIIAAEKKNNTLNLPEQSTNSPQTIPWYLHTANNCNHHYWSGICGNFCLRRHLSCESCSLCNGWNCSKDDEAANLTVFTYVTWAFAETKTRCGYYGCVERERKRREQERVEHVVTASSNCPGRLVY